MERIINEAVYKTALERIEELRTNTKNSTKYQ